MNERRLSTWDEYRSFVTELRDKHPAEDLFFRGQGNTDWPPATTLERSPVAKVATSLKGYYRLVYAIRSEIASATDASWSLPEFDEVAEKLGAFEPLSLELMSRKLPAFDYFGYLRQHGFPSPLLDWTRSPVIAAFFAFRSPRPEDRAVFVFLKSPDKVSHWSSDEPGIFDLGWRTGRHRRHFLQQSAYTICLKYRVGESKSEWDVAQHEALFQDPGGPVSDDGTRQDFLWKVTLPSGLRQPILKELDEHNLNAFSLFATDEALMETLANRETNFK